MSEPTIDENHVRIVARELTMGLRDERLWAMASFLENDDEEKTRKRYILLRLRELGRIALPGQ